jgi:hypothetical protein
VSAGFRVRTSTRVMRRFLMLLVIPLIILMGFELYRIIMPFQSANPLWDEVTIGQSVIHNWKYGGQDEEGYLKFYNQGQTTLLPPNAKFFDADGDFVILEAHTPSSLTFAQPYNAIPLSWILTGLIIIAIPTGLYFRRRRRKIAFKQRGRSFDFGRISNLPLKRPEKVRKFRSRRIHSRPER